ncbi:uncharacterized protein F4812DRAFT_442589 [Daldinia caldariorum]|uniref:uncharacterized protein n=1 Tax=Daldinia caldariorum TaxID=326644 RepID=UPI00200738DB|nr:uncharacterized protein F4812DRAFT_442589 [Daldinia caldariorum]KAI1464540.1 hypothetical protein F4812DRAFT_442589 [Daldinia caldariorum]
MITRPYMSLCLVCPLLMSSYLIARKYPHIPKELGGTQRIPSVVSRVFADKPPPTPIREKESKQHGVRVRTHPHRVTSGGKKRIRYWSYN